MRDYDHARFEPYLKEDLELASTPGTAKPANRCAVVVPSNVMNVGDHGEAVRVLGRALLKQVEPGRDAVGAFITGARVIRRP